MGLAGCGLLRTRWLANPLTGLAPLGPFKKVSNFSQKNQKFAQKVPQKVPQKDFTLVHMGKVIFLNFSKIVPPLGGLTQKKSISRLTAGPMGGPCQIWFKSSQWFGLQIRKNKQTDRQAGLFYMYR